MAKLIKGENLNTKQIEKVKASFIYRNTFENKANSQRLNPTCTIFTSDEDWIKSKAFYFTSKGELSGNHVYCEPSYMAE